MSDYFLAGGFVLIYVLGCLFRREIQPGKSDPRRQLFVDALGLIVIALPTFQLLLAVANDWWAMAIVALLVFEHGYFLPVHIRPFLGGRPRSSGRGRSSNASSDRSPDEHASAVGEER